MNGIAHQGATQMTAQDYRRAARATDDPDLARVLNDEADLILASSPDPDSAPCEYCGGGLAHYPECSGLR